MPYTACQRQGLPLSINCKESFSFFVGSIRNEIYPIKREKLFVFLTRSFGVSILIWCHFTRILLFSCFDKLNWFCVSVYLTKVLKFCRKFKTILLKLILSVSHLNPFTPFYYKSRLSVNMNIIQIIQIFCPRLSKLRSVSPIGRITYNSIKLNLFKTIYQAVN